MSRACRHISESVQPKAPLAVPTFRTTGFARVRLRSNYPSRMNP
jgi:hypothetical protein